ncbi:steroid hormone receptor ERR2-like [Culicoides brevitarsis]|uniref:steroid hormone receptor ERR2-like n=1 Tax=Culicoides brevitarsis TaxID=469753 RepID=UPI00307CC63A
MDPEMCSIKQEQDLDLNCGSPSQSSSCSNVESFVTNKRPLEQNADVFKFVQKYQKSESTSSSPDHQYCSSTSGIGDFNAATTTFNGGQEVGSDEIPKRVCLVCGDDASGFHYGVSSCEACKAFFKRTIQGSIEYSCPANKNCEINKKRRKACQACRFHKCLVMGMLKEGVRLDRVRGGRQKYRRNPGGTQAFVSQLQLAHEPSAVKRLDDIKLLQTMVAIEPQQLASHCGFDLTTRYRGQRVDAVEIFSVLSDLFGNECQAIIEWAKKIPEFSNLPMTDQQRLLQDSWTEIFTLMLVFRSMPFAPNGRLNFASDFWIDERMAEQCGAVELYNHYKLVAQRFDSINVRKEEYCLLKALVLFNCDIRLDNYMALKKLRDNVLTALNDCVLITRNENAIDYQQQFLLMLPSLRQCDHTVRDFWKKLQREGNISMSMLLKEMIATVSP